MIKLLCTAAAMSAAVATQAATYDAVADFSATPTVWSYGTGVAGSTFTPNLVFQTTCSGDARISCWQSPEPVSRVPLVAKNITAATVDTFDTVVMPTDVLNVHPGPDTDTIVRFTAPTSASYRISGFFELLDIKPSGVVVSIFRGGVSEGFAVLTGPGATFPDTVGESVPFGGVRYLTAGETLDFGVNNDGSYYNDSTGLSATLTTVPDAASWALMVVGFGLVGVVSRRRSAALAA